MRFAPRLAFFLLLSFLLSFSEVFASKYTGPKHVEVYARVLDDIGGRKPDSRIEWLRPPGDTRWLSAEVIAILSYDDNGWAMPTRDFLPRVLRIGAPPGTSTPGEVILASLDFTIGYAGKLEITHAILTTHLIQAGSGFALDPLLAKLEQLPEKKSAHGAWRAEIVHASADPERLMCSTGEHAVRRATLEAHRGAAAFQLSAARLHELEFHGAQLTPIERASLTATVAKP